MKKIFTLLVAFVATLSVMAQMPSALRFVGTGEFYLPAMQAQTQTTVLKDEVTVAMGETQSFVVPSMFYAGMNMTIPSFTVAGLSYTMTGSPQMGNMAFAWNAATVSTTTTDASGAEKDVTVTDFSAAYTHTTGKLTMDFTFKYGSMPFLIHYSIEAYYTPGNAYNLAGQGTANNPYKVYEPADFMAIANGVTAENTFEGVCFEQMNDIDFGGSEASPVQLPAVGKAAIAQIASVAYGFDGTYDGGNHAVKGIYHTAAANDEAGKFNALFSSVGTKGTVKNLVFDASNYVHAYNYVGTIASVNQGVIENCKNYAPVTAANAFAAGICAQMVKGNGVIRNCENHGDVKAMTYACGIIAGTQSGNSVAAYNYVVENCINNGNVSTVNGVGAAGIAGTYSGALRECTNNGTVNDAEGTGKSRMNTAGIVAAGNYITELANCVNNGTVNGDKNVAGIIANIMKADDADITISGCVNNGDIKALGTNVGGIAANSARVNGVVTLDNCSNYGKVETAAETELIGNLRGNASIVLKDCTIGSSLETLPLDPASTGIDTVNASETAAKNGKYVKDGRLVIMKDGNAYSVTGIKY